MTGRPKHRKSVEILIISKSQLEKRLMEIFRKYLIPSQWTSNRWPKCPRLGLVHPTAPCSAPWGRLVPARLPFEGQGPRLIPYSLTTHSQCSVTEVPSRYRGHSLSHSPGGPQPFPIPEQCTRSHCYTRQVCTCPQQCSGRLQARMPASSHSGASAGGALVLTSCACISAHTPMRR